MECPTCQQPVAAGARFCPACGTTTSGSASAAEGSVPRAALTRELRQCPACGADNSTARVLCARCGVDLDSGERPVAAPVVHRPGPAVDLAGDVSDTGGRDRDGNRTALVVAVIIVVGAIVGLLVGTWAVGAGREPARAGPAFDPAVYPEEPAAIEVSAVGASSVRPSSGGVGYGADNLVDDDVTTAWSHDPAVEAAADVDLALALADPAWVTSLTFANGAQSDELAFAADGRVLRVRLLVDGAAVAELQLLDRPGLQRVTLPEPVLVRTIRLVVVEAVPGDTYAEVSLSEIVVTGHRARGDDLARMVVDDPDATSDPDATPTP